MLKPVKDFLLVGVEKEKKEEKVTDSGIIVLEKSDDRDLQVAKGKVIDIGSKVTMYKKGQTVYYNFFSGNQVWVGEDLYHLVFQDDVLGVDD